MKAIRQAALPILLLLLLVVTGCYRGYRVQLTHRAESELDPARYPTLVVLDFDYRGGELELGELTARRLREEISVAGGFDVVPISRLTSSLRQIEGFDQLNPDHQRRLGELTGADLLVTGEVSFSRYGSQEYHELLAQSYDVTEQRSPSMIYGRSREAMERQTGELLILDVVIRGYSTATGEQVWRKDGRVSLERQRTSRTPLSRSELLSVFTDLLNDFALEVRRSLQPHLVTVQRYIIP